MLSSAFPGRRLAWPLVVAGLAGLSLAGAVALGDTASPPKNTVPPAVQGTAAAFETVTCLPGQWIPAAETYTYLWALDGSSEGMPTTATWKLTTSQVNHAISCDVTATDPTTGLHNVAASATVTVEQGEITNTALPVISGTPSPGKKLSCSSGSWSPQPDSYSYLWLKNGGTIQGATTAQYTVSDGDVGHTLTCQVVTTIGSNAASGNATSNGVTAANAPSATTTVTTTTTTTTVTTTTTTQPAVLKNTIAPHVTGIAASGQTLTCDPGSWTGNPTLSYTWFWRHTTPALPFTLKPKLPLVGLKRSLFVSSSYFLHPATVSAQDLARLGTAKTLTIQDIPTGSTVACTVTGQRGTQTLSATSAQITSQTSPPVLELQQRFPNGRIRTLPAPHITPGVGVGATNTCLPGSWNNYPTFTYAWYSLGPRIPGQLVRSRTLLARGETLTLAPSDENLDLQCVITAINAAGTNKAATNDYVVPINPPVPLQQPSVTIHTMEPTAASGMVGREGAQVIAEQIDLTCDPGKWDRGDLTFVTGWVPVAQAGVSGGYGDPSGWTVTGNEFDLDMRPGNLQWNLTVKCAVTATTSHGRAATSYSGPIQVWSGCGERLVSVQNGVQVGLSADLYAAPYALTGAGLIAGVAGLLGLETGIVNVFGTTFDGNPLSWIPAFGSGTTEVIYTYGPNCEDYQKYFMGQGYTVKQQPGDGP